MGSKIWVYIILFVHLPPPLVLKYQCLPPPFTPNNKKKKKMRKKEKKIKSKKINSLSLSPSTIDSIFSHATLHSSLFFFSIQFFIFKLFSRREQPKVEGEEQGEGKMFHMFGESS